MTIQLDQQQLDQIKQMGDAGNWSGIYATLGQITAQSGANDGLQAWFEAASHINANDGSVISEFVHGSTEAAARIVGVAYSDAEFQQNSDNLAQKIYAEINRNSSIPDMDWVIKADIATATNGLNLPIYAWAGTFGAPLPAPLGLKKNGDGARLRDPAMSLP